MKNYSTETLGTMISHDDKPRENNDTPDHEETKKFWENIWIKPIKHTEEAEWIKDELERNQRKALQEMKDHKVNITELKGTLRQMQNWKAAGIDGIQNFWYVLVQKNV